MRIDLGLIQMELDGPPRRPSARGLRVAAGLLRGQAPAGRRRRRRGLRARPEQLRRARCARGSSIITATSPPSTSERYDLVARDTTAEPPPLRLRGHSTPPTARQDPVRPVSALCHDDARPAPWASAALARDDHAAALTAIDGGSRASAPPLPPRVRPGGARGRVLRARVPAPVAAGARTRDRPVGPVERLEQQLEVAVTLEDYEEAARIRDQIRRLKATDPREHRLRGPD